MSAGDQSVVESSWHCTTTALPRFAALRCGSDGRREKIAQSGSLSEGIQSRRNLRSLDLQHFSDKWIEKAPTSSTDPACLLSPAKEDATASVEARLGLPICSLFHTRTSK